MLLSETISAFNRGGSRLYIDGKRASESVFNKLLLESGLKRPDHTQHGLNRQRETITRNFWSL